MALSIDRSQRTTHGPLDRTAAVGTSTLVRRWLISGTDEHKRLALETVDRTKQLHWFHEEYCDVWFDEPGMWAIESSEHCVLSLATGIDEDGAAKSHALLSIAFAIHSFRSAPEDSVRDAVSKVAAGVRRGLREGGSDLG